MTTKDLMDALVFNNARGCTITLYRWEDKDFRPVNIGIVDKLVLVQDDVIGLLMPGWMDAPQFLHVHRLKSWGAHDMLELTMTDGYTLECDPDLTPAQEEELKELRAWQEANKGEYDKALQWAYEEMRRMVPGLPQ
jgi:hypothetical protein